MKLFLPKRSVAEQGSVVRRRGWIAGAGLLLGAALPTWPAQSPAQERGPDPNETVFLEEVSCKDVMGQAGEDRDRSISFLHGFVLGGVGDGEVSIERIIDVETVFFDLCLDSPTASALSQMRSAHGLGDE